MRKFSAVAGAISQRISRFKSPSVVFICTYPSSLAERAHDAGHTKKKKNTQRSFHLHMLAQKKSSQISVPSHMSCPKSLSNVYVNLIYMYMYIYYIYIICICISNVYCVRVRVRVRVRVYTPTPTYPPTHPPTHQRSRLISLADILCSSM